jgi:hypothetical protein
LSRASMQRPRLDLFQAEAEEEEEEKEEEGEPS